MSFLRRSFLLAFALENTEEFQFKYRTHFRSNHYRGHGMFTVCGHGVVKVVITVVMVCGHGEVTV